MEPDETPYPTWALGPLWCMGGEGQAAIQETGMQVNYGGEARGRMHVPGAGQLSAPLNRGLSVKDDQLLSGGVRSCWCPCAQSLWPTRGTCQSLCGIQGPKSTMGSLFQGNSPVMGLQHRFHRPISIHLSSLGPKPSKPQS